MTRMQRHHRPQPTKTPRFKLIANWQIAQLSSDGHVDYLQSRTASVNLTAMLRLKGANLIHDPLLVRRDCHRCPDTIAIIKQRLTKVGPKAIARPVHDQVAGEPDILAPVAGESTAREKTKEKGQTAHGVSLRTLWPFAKPYLRNAARLLTGKSPNPPIFSGG